MVSLRSIIPSTKRCYITLFYFLFGYHRLCARFFLAPVFLKWENNLVAIVVSGNLIQTSAIEFNAKKSFIMESSIDWAATLFVMP